MNPEQLEQLQAQFQQISADLSSGDLAKVKAAQTQLQALGYDIVPDGRLGAKTSAAVGELRKSISDAQTNIRLGKEAAAREAENDPTNQLTKMATEFGPWAAGVTTGVGTGIYTGKKFNAEDAAQKQSGSALAKAMDIKPEASQNALKRLDQRRVSRGAKQFLGPASLFGAGAFTSEVVAPRFEDQPETQKWINLAATTENAAGAGMAAKQLYDLGTRKDPIDPLDRARIESRAMPTPAQVSPALQQALASPQAKAPSGPPMRHSDRLKKTATAAGAKPGKTKSANVEAIKKNLTAQNMPDVAESLNLPRTASRSTILQRLREISNVGGKYVWPAMAGAIAYDAVTSDAEAAGEGGTASNVLKGTVAGTAAGATTAGGIKLADMLGKVVPTTMRALSGGLVAGLPTEIANAFDNYSPEEATAGSNRLMNQQARFQEATGLPDWLMGSNVAEAREMATVPEKNPARVYGNAYRPGGGKAPQVNFPPKLMSRLERMRSQGANDDQIASWLNRALP